MDSPNNKDNFENIIEVNNNIIIKSSPIESSPIEDTQFKQSSQTNELFCMN